MVSREVITIDQLPVGYGPVFEIPKNEFSLQLFSDAVFKSFETAGIKLKLPPFAENPEIYKEFQKNMLKQYKEPSFQQLAKKSNLYILDWEDKKITFMPTIYTKRGNFGDEDHNKSILVTRKLKIQVAQEILDLMNEYKELKSLEN